MAGAITVVVTPEVLSDTAQKVQRIVGTLRQGFGDVQKTIEKTKYYWIGRAGDQKRAEFASQKAEIEEILTRFAKYPSDLLEMADIYTTAEKTVSNKNEALATNFLD